MAKTKAPTRVSYPKKAAKAAAKARPGTSAPRRGRPAKTARIEARLSDDVKSLVQQAADLRGETLTDFVLAASREKALETLREAQLIRLTVDDQRRFAESLLAPQAPPRRLRDAAERYRQLME